MSFSTHAPVFYIQVPNRMSPATGAATLKKFAEDARSADLAEEHDKPSASVSPTHTRMSVADTVICLVALVVALGLALIMPTSMVTPASNLTTFPSTAVLPQGDDQLLKVNLVMQLRRMNPHVGFF